MHIGANNFWNVYFFFRLFLINDFSLYYLSPKCFDRPLIMLLSGYYWLAEASWNYFHVNIIFLLCIILITRVKSSQCWNLFFFSTNIFSKACPSSVLINYILYICKSCKPLRQKLLFEFVCASSRLVK